jgi:hypothetical protein
VKRPWELWLISALPRRTGTLASVVLVTLRETTRLLLVATAAGVHTKKEEAFIGAVWGEGCVSVGLSYWNLSVLKLSVVWKNR